MLFGKVCLITKIKMNTRSSIPNHSKNSEMLEGSEASNNDFASNSASTMAQNNEPMVLENCQLPVDHKVCPDDGNLLIPASTSSSTVGCLPVVFAAVAVPAVAATADGVAATTTIPNLPAGGFSPLWSRRCSPKVCWIYSQILLSRAPLTRGNQLVALVPWTPNFSDSSLAAAHMTEPVTHMWWSEQISPLVHSSQATWQLFNLSHCIEMHNTHLLGHVG